MTEAGSLDELQAKNDALLTALEGDRNADLLQQAFLPAMIFPGPQRQASNLAAWKGFWSPARVASLKQVLQSAGQRNDFAAGAFAPFYKSLAAVDLSPSRRSIPKAFFSLMGVWHGPEGSRWRQFANLSLPPGVSGRNFYERYHNYARIFDPALFSRQLGHLMFSTFSKLLLIVGPAVAALLLVFFFDLRLTLIALAPVVFALLSTLGTLHLMGRPLDLPSLMLAVVILGMGIDYSLFVVRSYQRYGRADHPAFALIRSAVVMTSASTLIGFGVLATARHALLRSVGITSFLGIAYSALGAFLILPPLLKRIFEAPAKPMSASGTQGQRVLARYRLMEPYARMFARFKMVLDPMFAELPGLVEFAAPPRILVDIGSGFGVPACWLAETFPSARIYGIEPAPDRVRVAQRALGERGSVICDQAPALPPAPGRVDGAFMLDMLHYLSDPHLHNTLTGLHGRMTPGARLLIRAVMVPTRRWKWCWWLENLKDRLGGPQTCYRSVDRIEAMLRQNGFTVQAVVPSGRHGEMLWFKCQRKDGGAEHPRQY